MEKDHENTIHILTSLLGMINWYSLTEEQLSFIIDELYILKKKGLCMKHLRKFSQHLYTKNIT